MRAFSQFCGMSPIGEGIIWQEIDSDWPYTCSQCRRQMGAGIRYVGNSMKHLSHKPVATICADCKAGVDPNAEPVPKLAERKTELD